jgi:glycosyltransferase involved in cell wall biosynthesis
MTAVLSVVNPVKSGSKDIDRLLQSLANQLDAEPFEVHVVFNPKKQRIRNLGLANLKTWVCAAGVNRARNVGIDHCQGHWIYLLDADCVLHDPRHLQKVCAQLKTASEDTVYGGPYILSEGAGAVARAYHWVQDHWVREGWHPQHGWVHLLGGNLLAARALFSTLKFDDDIVFGGSETDFLARWLRLGGRAEFLPQLGVLHVQSLHQGILQAKYSYVGFADADLSYPFIEFERLLQPLLRDEADFVLGSRLRGQMEHQAMPFLNSYLGTPVLSFCIRLVVGQRISDCNSGMRVFRREIYERLNLRCGGMEYASEMLIRVAQNSPRLGEVPINFKRDERGRPSHLRRWRDGSRHLRFIAGCAPSRFRARH